jgi:hypothetical protein
MAVFAPIERYDNAATGLGLAPPPKQGLQLTGQTSDESAVRHGLGLQYKLMQGLQAILGAPGAEALIGGPMAVRPFFHGTTRAAADEILKGGFRPSVKPNQHNWGQGAVFFGEQPEIADAYANDIYNALKRMGLPAEDTRGVVLKALIDDEKLLDMSHVSPWSLLGGGQHNYVVDEMKAKGLGGIRWNGETTVYDPSLIQNVERHK